MGRGETVIRLSHAAPSPIRGAMRSLVPVAALAALAACAPVIPSAPPAPPVAVPSPRPAPPPPPPAAVHWSDWPVASGDWIYRREGQGSTALFGQRADAPELTLRCDPVARQIVMIRRGTAAGPVTVRTTSATRALTAVAMGDAMIVRLAAGDTLLDAMGYSRGRFVVEMPPLAPLVVPSWAEVQRVVEDCRR